VTETRSAEESTSGSQSNTGIDRLLFYVLAVVLGIGLWTVPADDFDLGWQLLGGRWIVEHHELPSQDFINAFNPGWHDYHWLAQIVVFAIYRCGGFAALRLALGILMAYLAKLLVDIVSIVLPGRIRPAHVLSFFGAWLLLSEIAAVRPQMLAVCLLALAVRRLIQPPARFELPYLFGLTVALVNMHVYWIFVPLLFFYYRVMEAAPNAPRRWAGLALLAGAGFASPYAFVSIGNAPPFLFINYALLYDYLHVSNRLRELIMEFKGALAVPIFSWVLVLAYIVVVANSLRRDSIGQSRSDLASGISAVLLSLTAAKFNSLLAVAGLPLLARATSDLEGRLASVMTPAAVKRGGTTVTVGLMLCITWGVARASSCIPFRCSNDGIIEFRFPIDLCARLARSGITPSNGRSFVEIATHFNDGGWCRWAAYEASPSTDIRVTTDGRTQWVPPAFYDQMFDLFDLRGDWQHTLDGWKPDVLIVPRGTPLYVMLLARNAEWTNVYEGNLTGAFVPSGANFKLAP